MPVGKVVPEPLAMIIHHDPLNRAYGSRIQIVMNVVPAVQFQGNASVRIQAVAKMVFGLSRNVFV